jgi:YEATS family
MITNSSSNINVPSSYAVSGTNFNLKSSDSQMPQKNLNNEIISKSIVYGSVAFWLGKKSEQNLTHKWCVYVRGLNNEDISYFIKEVVFTLHATFENNVRTITKWPYELYASGWGEFDIKITIHLIDESFKPIEFVHFLKLYPPANQTASTKRPIVSEFFDEIVFVNPKKHLRECLLSPANGVKKETSIQIPLNIDDDKRPENSIMSEEIKEKNVIENKLEKLSISGNILNHQNSENMILNENHLDEMEIDGFENTQGNQGIGGVNNDSISVFSNNVNVNKY